MFRASIDKSISGRRSGRRAAARLFELAALEARVLYCLDGGADADALPSDMGSYAAVQGPFAGAAMSGGGAVGSVAVASGVPALASNPTATAKLYLDFNGAAAMSWGGYSVTATPAFDQNGDAGTFSDAELATIREIWARVAEKYSPFNLDVTTVDPGTYQPGKVLRVVIGGDGAWAGGVYGGLSYVSSFNSSNNTSFAFSANLGNGNALYTAEAAAHEAGHGFGLQHQSSYDGSGNKTAEYNTGTSAVAPVMGTSYYSTRGVWWNGTSSIGSTVTQDDMARIASSLNGFGFRTDDHGNTAAAADALATSGDNVSGAGVIERNTDGDYFKVVTGGGAVSLSANVVAAGATLDLRLVLFDGSGVAVATADTASLGESLSLNLTAGTYYLDVQSEGHYGDVGQYTLTGSVPAPAASVFVAPSGLVAQTAAGVTTLTWTDNANSESGFQLQRSDDGGATWAQIATVGADVTTYDDAAPGAGGRREYRVCAYDASTTTVFSNVATVWAAPVAPSGVTAKAAAATQVNVTWNAVNGATGYVVQRSANGGASWVSVATVSGGATVSFANTGLAAGTTYAYRVCATDPGGASDYSAAATATTPIPPPVPAAPTRVTATAVGSGRMRVTWTDMSKNETGFRVEYSCKGSGWVLLGKYAAGTTTCTVSGLSARKSYVFRLSAYNANGSSAYALSAYALAAAPVRGAVVAAAAASPTAWAFSTTLITLGSSKAVLDSSAMLP